MKIFGDLNSGNCLKVKWVSEALGLPFTWIDVDITKGESRTPDFLAINPAGQVPTVLFDDGRALAQSNAIIRYLARGSRFIPPDPFEAAKMDEWLFLGAVQPRALYRRMPLPAGLSAPPAGRARSRTGEARLRRARSHGRAVA